MDWKSLFLSAEGRIGQKDFWVGAGILFLLGLIFNQIDALGWLWSLASIYFGVCVYTKRLHDIGKSGWLVLVPLAIMCAALVIGLILGGAAFLGGAATGSDALAAVGGLAGAGIASLVVLVGVVACFGFVIWLGTRPSDGENRFGPPRSVPLVTAF